MFCTSRFLEQFGHWPTKGLVQGPLCSLDLILIEAQTPQTKMTFTSREFFKLPYFDCLPHFFMH